MTGIIHPQKFLRDHPALLVKSSTLPCQEILGDRDIRILATTYFGRFCFEQKISAGCSKMPVFKGETTQNSVHFVNFRACGGPKTSCNSDSAKPGYIYPPLVRTRKGAEGGKYTWNSTDLNIFSKVFFRIFWNLLTVGFKKTLSISKPP